MRPQVGQVINNKYRLLRLIGDGGMGSVYEARHEVLGTSVALKFLHAELGKRPGLVQRFLQEARVSAQIQSPHVVRVTDVDQTDTGAFIVMEYIEGKTLQALYEDLYKAGLQLSYADALEYSMQMLEGVDAAHRSGIVHRDLKPDNVMITSDAKGRRLIKLLDFGIAKLRISGELEKALTRPGVIMGTPEYMAPEQAFSADAVDARADIFSLGVIIFEMLAGRRPVGGEDPHQIAGAYLSGQISRLTDLAPDIAPELADAVHRAMAALSSERWSSVSELRDAVEPFAVAAKVPSVMSSMSIALSSLSGVTPNPSLARPFSMAHPEAVAPLAESAGQRAVPKTLPPDDGPAPAASPGTDTSPADPPAMSDPMQRGPTPLGGFAPFAEAAGELSAAGAVHGLGGDPPMAELAGSSAGAEVGPPFVPPTRSVLPISGSYRSGSSGRIFHDGGRPPMPPASGDPAATALAEPLPMGAPDFYAGSPLPSGTVPLSMESGAAPLPPIPPVIASVGSKASQTRRKPGALSSLPAILLLAAGVSAAVVGGVYIAHRQSKTDDHEDPPALVPTPTVAADPPPPPADTPAPPVVPPVSQPWKPTTPFKPPPRGSAAPVAPTAPSSNPPNRVPILPSVPFIIPSSLPFDFPFGPPSRPRNEPPSDPPRGRQPPPPQRGDDPGPRGALDRSMFHAPHHAARPVHTGFAPEPLVDAAFAMLRPVLDARAPRSRWGLPPNPRSRWGLPPDPRALAAGVMRELLEPPPRAYRRR